MDKKSIIKSVKRQEEEKVAFSLKLPASLKDQLQILAESESISMNSLIIATLQSFIDDDCGKKLNQSLPWVEAYEAFLANNLDSLESIAPDGPNYFDNLNSVKNDLKEIKSYIHEVQA